MLSQGTPSLSPSSLPPQLQFRQYQKASSQVRICEHVRRGLQLWDCAILSDSEPSFLTSGPAAKTGAAIKTAPKTSLRVNIISWCMKLRVLGIAE